MAHLRSTRVSIIGGGLSGLLTAHGLFAAGFRHLRLFESAGSFTQASRRLREGAVVLTPNGARAMEHVLTGSAAYQDIHQAGRALSLVSARTLAGHSMHSFSPEELSATPGDHNQRAYLAIRGARLHDALISSLPSSVQVHFHSRLDRVAKARSVRSDPETDDTPVRMHFAPTADAHLKHQYASDGEGGIETDLVIGADGPDSVVRASIPYLASTQPTFLGGQYVRGLCTDMTGMRDAQDQPLRPDHELHEVWGRGEKFSWYWVDERTISWLGVTQAGRQQGQMFTSFPSPIPSLLLASSSSSSIESFPISELCPHPSPSLGGRLVVVGEAAQRTTQELWQSASQVCEDAAVLTVALGGVSSSSAGFSFKDALSLYGSVRYPRIQFVSSAAREETKQALQAGRVMSAVRDMATSMMPPSVVRETTRQLLSYDAVRDAQTQMQVQMGTPPTATTR